MAEGRTAFDVEPDGWYVEPEACTTFLLQRERFDGLTVWDPACGRGNIVRTMRGAGVNAYGTDLVMRWPFPGQLGDPPESPFNGVVDFLNPHRGIFRWFDAIVTNPPYGRAKTAEAFIRQALSLDRTKKLAVFVNAKFLFGAGRASGLFREHIPSQIWPIFPRPSCLPGQYLEAGGKAEGGVENYCWVVWERVAVTDRPVLLPSTPAASFGC